MAGAQKLYPRGTVKRIIKAHSKRPLSKNVDVLVFLDYELFVQDLLREASINSKQAGERGISARSVRKVTNALSDDLVRCRIAYANSKDEVVGTASQID
ncbi:MAG: hypothetical protein M1824_002734 [Vezdaea acicularis]|nr:MAG: hypothetical protein M1824_002734 [Vezdaea acicularis]